ncbi:MAG: AraC family transcriptional regulator [Lachnospiraceae bacterium]|nr:AraC family transcriptional regulator [Lachnospiraceae bacterium]
MKEQDTLLQEDFNPSFLFTWKGIRREDEKSYHRHEHLEFCYVMSGQGRHRIEDRIYEVREGDLILINAGEYHQALIRGEGEPAVEFYVGLTDIYLKGHEKNCLPQPEEEPILHTSGELKMKLGRLCISMESEKERERFGGYFMMKTYALQMLLLFLREQEQPGAERPVERYPFESVNRKYMVEKIMDYFEEHYMQKISLGQIAGNMYLSPFYISKIFKAETGETPIHFLIEIRMEKARELLLADPALSIQEVAARVGYDDAYHFSKLFKKKFGTAPSAMRKKDG